MPYNIELLRDLWKYIDPHSSMVSHTVSKMKAENWRAKEHVCIHNSIMIAKQKVAHLHTIGRLDKVKGGFRSFCLKHDVSIV